MMTRRVLIRRGNADTFVRFIALFILCLALAGAPYALAANGPAGANTRVDPASRADERTATFEDPVGDAERGIDMNRVTLVRHPRAITVRTHFAVGGYPLNGVQYFFDTVGKRPGPEYGAVAYRTKDGDGLHGLKMYKTKGWVGSGPHVPCQWRDKWHFTDTGARTATGPHRRPGYFITTFGLKCFEGSADKRVRVHVTTWDYTKYAGSGRDRHPTRGHDDEMGDPTQFTRWVVS